MLEEILSCMAIAKVYKKDQRIQTRHRIRLAKSFGIEPGDRILEIGCGQGDTTAVLAYMVGDEGFVHGIDIASSDYGSPVSVGESAEFLMNSSLGDRIRMEYEVDFLGDDVFLDQEGYDVVVLSHSSWYLKSHDELLEILQKANKVADRLCFAEADIRIDRMEQLPHLLAVLIQAQIESVKTNSTANIRTLVTRDDAIRLMNRAGWRIVEEARIHEPDLQDGDWEIQYTLHEALLELERMETPSEKWGDLLQSMGELLEHYENQGMSAPLGSYILIGE